MREHILVRTARALVAVAILSQFAQNQVCRAAFLNIYGGPTYSGVTGGYQATNSGIGGRMPSPSLSNGLFLTDPIGYGAVNNAGVAVSNVVRFDAPLSSTPQNVYESVATWSATNSPVILSSGSSTSFGFAYAINDVGFAGGEVVTGETDVRTTSSQSGDGTHATAVGARWNAPNPALIPLGGLTADPASTGGVVFAINAQDAAVGSASAATPGFGTRAVRWDAGSTTATQLGILDTPPNTFFLASAFAINNSGTIVGRVMNAQNSTEAVRWDAGGTTATKLDNLGTPAFSNSGAAATSINDVGTIVGYANKYAPDGTLLGYRAVRWNAGGTVATELGNLGTDANSKTQMFALAINSAGTIIGDGFAYQGGTPTFSAVRWDAGSTTAIKLDPLSTTPFNFAAVGLPSTTANAINALGLVVGTAQTVATNGPLISPGPSHAVYWNSDGTIVDLNSLISPSSGWVLNNATAISDTGWILGVGTYSGYQRPFLIQVPEPSSFVLLALASIGGLAGVICRRR